MRAESRNLLVRKEFLLPPNLVRSFEEGVLNQSDKEEENVQVTPCALCLHATLVLFIPIRGCYPTKMGQVPPFEGKPEGCEWGNRTPLRLLPSRGEAPIKSQLRKPPTYISYSNVNFFEYLRTS